MCEAAGKELFGHLKVGKRSLGSNASLFDGLRAEKVLACLSSLCRWPEDGPGAGGELGPAWEVQKVFGFESWHRYRFSLGLGANRLILLYLCFPSVKSG